MQRGIATFTLDYGKCPKWLFERMVKLGREMARVIVTEYGPDEFIKRIGDPVWFQSLGTVLAFDWNASGLTTTLTAALKEAIKGNEKDLGIFICGGKGKTSLKTPGEIRNWGERLSLPESTFENLVYNSKMSAKVDSSLVQDGFQIYHHAFFFSVSGSWTVVQQGMNEREVSARRYHWFSENINDLVCEPHSGISSDVRVPTMNLVAKESQDTRDASVELIANGYKTLMKDIELLNKYTTSLNQMVRFRVKKNQLTLLNLENKEFHSHPVINKNFRKSKYLEKILWQVCEEKPKNYEKLLSLTGVGPKTIRSLALVGEVIYGARPSYEDPARYSFAHGGKDGTPYFVDRLTYDRTISIMRELVNKTKIEITEKNKILRRFRIYAK